MTSILIAPNAFKNSLSATAAAEAIRDGLMKSNLHCRCECFPIGDGGDGTGELIMNRCNGTAIPVIVNDPLARKMEAAYGRINHDSCFIEMADASGLRLLTPEELNPLRATSAGTGELIKAALDNGIRTIMLGMGGSATVDGGTGILEALGVAFLDHSGNRLTGLPESLVNLASIDVTAMDKRIISSTLTVLCDVDNRLLGNAGSAAMFGPQKGASTEAVARLEAALTRFNEVVLKQTGIDMSALQYGGTAGGAAAGLHSLLHAKLVNGIEYFLDLTGFDMALEHADIVITGEGSIDEQTLQGKGPYGVAVRAKKKGLPVIAIAGKVPLVAHNQLRKYFDVLMPLGNEPMELKTALASGGANLLRAAFEMGNLLAMKR